MKPETSEDSLDDTNRKIRDEVNFYPVTDAKGWIMPESQDDLIPLTDEDDDWEVAGCEEPF
jgi:hypothetical protein